ncbi:hypothetical protein A0H81_12627 [Grifola frondosa]|uniref:Uncharacterized protein n=1 Tax=Grifola frondosa TaxID=5627 RepID=A0A1C7LRX3_GRIFR|nr:hypothetical protein A0H81_12627 [Grifola frondosa]
MPMHARHEKEYNTQDDDLRKHRCTLSLHLPTSLIFVACIKHTEDAAINASGYHHRRPRASPFEAKQ